jgi:hypothetical protein
MKFTLYKKKMLKEHTNTNHKAKDLRRKKRETEMMSIAINFS